MKGLYTVFAVIAVVLILAVGFFHLANPLEAQANREVEIKRVNMSTGQQVTTRTIGVPVGISCLQTGGGVTECFVVSTR